MIKAIRSRSRLVEFLWTLRRMRMANEEMQWGAGKMVF